MELPLLATPSDVFASILLSRSVGESIIRNNNLMEILDIETMDETLVALGDIVDVSVGDEGIIYISVETKDPQLSLDIANDYLSEIDRVNREKRKTKAHEMRRFIEKRLAQNKADLASAENALKEFQETNRLVSVEEQTRATLSIAAELMAELQMKRVELGVLKKSLNSSHQQMRLLQDYIREIDKQIEQLGFAEKAKEGGNDTGVSSMPNIPIQEIPRLGLEYFRLLREVKTQETIFELLMQQYEEAKIQEKRDTPTIQILDHPVLPEIKSRPQRRLIVLISGLMSLVFGIVLVVVIEHFQELKRTDPDAFSKYALSFETLRQDFSRLHRGKKR